MGYIKMVNNQYLKCPFPYFGGKSKIADVIWGYFGDVKKYIEPFYGSGACLLNRPQPFEGDEIVVDKDGHICNVWRALQSDPDAVAKVCDYPINHAELSARKKRLNKEGEGLLQKLIDDDTYYDIELAGYYIWAASCWIGAGLTRINQIPELSTGKGIHTVGKRPHLTGSGNGIHAVGQKVDSGITSDVREPYQITLWNWFRVLSKRLRYVRVVCGDWTRVCGGNWQDDKGNVAIFFDPPYSLEAGRDNSLYSQDSLTVAHDVRKWCIARGKLKTHRIILAGYEGEHNELENLGWFKHEWTAGGGYSTLRKTGDNENRKKERLWISPHCIFKSQVKLF